jgi:hypothetical protein
MDTPPSVEQKAPRAKPAAWLQGLVLLVAIAVIAGSAYLIIEQTGKDKDKVPTELAEALRAASAPKKAPAKPADSGSRLSWIQGGVRWMRGITTQLESVKDEASAKQAVAKLLEPVGKFNGFAEQMVIHEDILESDYTSAEKAQVAEVDKTIEKLKTVAEAALEKGKGNESFQDAARRAVAAAERVHQKLHKK